MSRYLYRRMNREFRKVKFRAAGSIALVMVAVATYVSMSSMMPSTMTSLEDKVTELALSDYTVHVWSANESLGDAVRAIPGVATVEHRITYQSRIYYQKGGAVQTYSATLVGIEPYEPPSVSKFEMREGDGSFFTGDGNGTALLDKGFALAKEFPVGGEVSVKTMTGNIDVKVIGRVFSAEYIFMPINPQSVIPMPGMLAVLVVPIDWLRASFGLSSAYVNEFTMLFDEGRDQAALQAAVDRALAPATVVYSIPKDQVYGYALVHEDLKSGDEFSGMLGLMILLVAFFVVYSSFARIVQEQRSEIGVLRALGYSRVSVLGSYLYMAGILGLIGSIIGILISFPIGRSLTDFYVDMVVHTSASSFAMSTNAAISGLIFGPATAMMACGIAVWGTVSMEPQAAIKGMSQKRKVRTPKERIRGSHVGRRSSYITYYTTRSISRHKSRTALTVVAISFAIALGCMPILLIASFSNSMKESVTSYEHWDLVVDYAIPLDETTAQTVSTPGIVETVQISKFVKEWRKGADSGMAVVIGLDTSQTLHTFAIEKGRVARGPGEVMVGYKLSNDYNIAVGSTIEAATATGNATLTVTAVVDDMIGQLFVDLPMAREMAGVLTFGGMYVKAEAGAATQVREALLGNLLVADVQFRDAMQSGLLDLMSSYATLLYIFALFGVTISTITIANIVFVGVLERYYEYAQLRAVGYSRRSITKSILMEILIVLAISSIVAAPLSYAVIVGFASEYKNFWPVYTTILYLGDWLGYLIVVALTFAFGFLAAVPGIRYVSRMDIAKTVTGGQFG